MSTNTKNLILNTKNLEPWVERYRPKNLSEVVGQEEIIKRLAPFVNDRSLPHLLFAGDAGIGKTTTALALVREIQGKYAVENETFKELNASDARGIDVVRTDIKDFAKTKPPQNVPFKILILDECDSMTGAAQQALRRTMENYAKNCRFILICNYSNKIILPIQSRTSFLRFKSISDIAIKNRLKYIALNEGVSIGLKGLETIIYVSNGDLRKSVNILQSCSAISSTIEPETIFQISGQLKPEEIQSIVTSAIEKNFRTSYKIVTKFLSERGLSGKNLIQQINKEVFDLKYDDIVKHKIMKILGRAEKNISQGATEVIQLSAMIVKMSQINIKN